MTMTYSVLGRTPEGYPQRSTKELRRRLKRIEEEVAALPADTNAVAPGDALRLDRLTTLIHRMDRLLPEVKCFIVGYEWGLGLSGGRRPWTTWSGHATRAEARKFLKMWKASPVAHAQDDWVIREGTCDVGKFMPTGTDPKVVLKRLRA